MTTLIDYAGSAAQVLAGIGAGAVATLAAIMIVGERGK